MTTHRPHPCPATSATCRGGSPATSIATSIAGTTGNSTLPVVPAARAVQP